MGIHQWGNLALALPSTGVTPGRPPTFQDAKSKKDFLILHYTYGQDFDLSGRFMPGKIGKWRFDKRQFMSKYPPRYASTFLKMSLELRHTVR